MMIIFLMYSTFLIMVISEVVQNEMISYSNFNLFLLYSTIDVKYRVFRTYSKKINRQRFIQVLGVRYWTIFIIKV